MKTYSINSNSAFFSKIALQLQSISHRFIVHCKNSFFGIARHIWAIRRILYLLALLIFLFWGTPVLQNTIINYLAKKNMYTIGDEQIMQLYTEDLKKQTEKTIKQYVSLTPNSTFLVVNSTENEFFLYKKKEIVLKGKCSTGSYIMLRGVDSTEWVFKTPKGMFTVKGKVKNPVWKKPDWAFVEEGLPVPSPNHPSRYEYGVLGDYALTLGDGYMLHGTLYKRFIGLPVTHGCIRLGDDDLKTIYHSLAIGSKVIIY